MKPVLVLVLVLAALTLLLPTTLLAIIWITAVTNTVNFMDGMDGLIPGTALFACAAVATLATGPAATLALPHTTLAQAYPNKAVRLVVPYSVGIGPDVVARSVGDDDVDADTVADLHNVRRDSHQHSKRVGVIVGQVTVGVTVGAVTVAVMAGKVTVQWMQPGSAAP